MSIEIEYDQNRDLTTVIVDGIISSDEMHSALEAIYAHGPTAFILWDMTLSDLSIITPDELLNFTRKAAKLGEKRKDGLTAILAPEDLHSGFTKLAENFTNALPFSVKIFRAREDAMSWLFSD